MKWSRLRIRSRITGGSLLIAALISIAAGTVIYGQVERIVSDGQVSVLISDAAPYLTALSLEPTDSFDPPAANQLIGVIDPGGVAQINTLPTTLASMSNELTNAPGTRTISSGSTSYLVRTTPVTTVDGTWFVIAASTNDLQQSVLNQVAALLVVGIAAINLAFGGASWLIGGAVLGPVTRLRRSADALAHTSTRDLLPVGPPHDEIAELAETLNGLLQKMRESADRERQIISDASHELRTPIAILQTQLELALGNGASLSQLKKDVTTAQGTAARLAALATAMLDLSRIEAQTSRGSATAQELGRELADAADRGRRRVGKRQIRIEYDSIIVDGSDVVPMRADDFARLCNSLLANSLAAMDSQGVVELTLVQHESELVLSVKDDAGGMQDDFLPHAVNRFSQADPSRASGGSGLGLAIVSALLDSAGGSLRLVNTAGVGLEVVAHFPVQPRHS